MLEWPGQKWFIAPGPPRNIEIIAEKRVPSMSAASDMVNAYRRRLSEGGRAGSPPNQANNSADTAKKQTNLFTTRRRRRTFLAFCAALFAVSGTYFIAGTNIPGAIANEGGDAASFFRADRARNRVQRAIRNSSYVPVLSIFGRRDRQAGKTRNVRRNGRPVRQNTRRSRKIRKAARSNFRYARGTRSVCVRLCDGYHFPVGDLKRSGNVKAHEAICSGLCPGAPTRLYKFSRGVTDISEAVSVRTGQRYADLPVALRYTGKRDKTCSCKAITTPHLALVSLRKDFTLRKGDAVFTKRGIRIFKGAKRWPYRLRDFTTIRRTRGLRRSDKRKLYALERASSKRTAMRHARKRLNDATRIAGAAPTLPAIGPMPNPRPRHLAGGFKAR